jgi:hypothetical protein
MQIQDMEKPVNTTTNLLNKGMQHWTIDPKSDSEA